MAIPGPGATKDIGEISLEYYKTNPGTSYGLAALGNNYGITAPGNLIDMDDFSNKAVIAPRISSSLTKNGAGTTIDTHSFPHQPDDYFASGSLPAGVYQVLHYFTFDMEGWTTGTVQLDLRCYIDADYQNCTSGSGARFLWRYSTGGAYINIYTLTGTGNGNLQGGPVYKTNLVINPASQTLTVQGILEANGGDSTAFIQDNGSTIDIYNIDSVTQPNTTFYKGTPNYVDLAESHVFKGNSWSGYFQTG